MENGFQEEEKFYKKNRKVRRFKRRNFKVKEPIEEEEEDEIQEGDQADYESEGVPDAFECEVRDEIY